VTDTVEWVDARITDEGIQAAVDRIGVSRPIRPSVITEESVQRFAFGVGDDNPLWWDRGYAEATGWAAMFGPPTSILSGGRGRPGEKDAGSTAETILPGVLGLWVGHRWNFHRPGWVGEHVSGSTALHAVEEGQSSFSGSRTVTHTERTEFLGSDGGLIAEFFSSIRRFERGPARQHSKYLDIPEPCYTAGQLEAVYEQYERESGQRQGAAPRYFEDVTEGDDILTLVKGPLTMSGLLAIVQASGGSAPANRLMYQHLRDHPGARLVNSSSGIEDSIAAGHWDPYFSRQSGLPRPYDVATMRAAWFAHLLSDWMGDSGFITEINMRVRRPNFVGDTTWLSGTVVRKRDAEPGGLVECALLARNQREEISTTAVASVRLPHRPTEHPTTHAPMRPCASKRPEARRPDRWISSSPQKTTLSVPSSGSSSTPSCRRGGTATRLVTRHSRSSSAWSGEWPRTAG
jgi:acyl dehydratase